MTTRLETIVDYLAGRDGDGDGDDIARIRIELDDPSSEASRFLEATRSRTRALIEDRPPAGLPVSPPPRRSSVVGRAAGIAAIAATVLAATVATLGLGEVRLRRLEATLARGEAESRDHARRLEAALARSAEPARVTAIPTPPPTPSLGPSRPTSTEMSLARVEAGLGKLERRIDGLDRPRLAPGPAPTPAPIDPAIAEIRVELAALRRDLAAVDQARARQMQEVRETLGEFGQFLRLAIERPGVPMPNFPNQALPNLTGAIPTQVQALILRLSSPQHQARLEAVQQLARMGAAAQGAIPSLQQLLARETDPHVRSAAQATLSLLQSE